MGILVVRGLTHHGTTLQARESIAMPKQCLPPALQFLRQQPGVTEAVILSTCNRTECYVIADTASAGLCAIDRFIERAAQVHGKSAEANLTLLDDEAALHLFRVAGGLDSAIFGETQIRGQVSGALQAAGQADTSGPVLTRLFNSAVSCAKTIHKETEIARTPTSVAAVAVETAKARCGHWQSAKTLIIGAGEVARLCVKQLQISKCKNEQSLLTLLNRSEETLELLRNSLPYSSSLRTTTDFSRLKQLCQESDIIFVTTSASDFVLNASDFDDEKERLVIDFAVPRNVEPQVAELPGVVLLTIDELNGKLLQNLRHRKDVLVEAEPILLETLQFFKDYLQTEPAVAELMLLP